MTITVVDFTERPPVATPETHIWVGKRCGIVTDYETVCGDCHVGSEPEYDEGDHDDCLECDDPDCIAYVLPKVPTTSPIGPMHFDAATSTWRATP